MSTDLKQEVINLRAKGLDCSQIASKLNLPVDEVEAIVYGTSEPDDLLLQFWAGQHH